jgi:hypothetical protein
MKLQILDEGLESNREGENLFHFLTSLTQENNYARESRFNPQTSVSFFNELDTETRTMLVTFVSFFNEVSIETQNYPHSWFHFLTSLKSEDHAQQNLLDHDFQDVNAPEGHHVKGQKLVMSSKRSSFYGRNTLWNERMSTTGRNTL